MQDWSAPDASGICTRAIDVGAKATLRGRRQRQCFEFATQAAATWPQDWRELARKWLSGSDAPMWKTLQKQAGAARIATAADLLPALLAAGWIRVDEHRESGRWAVSRVQFVDMERSRAAVGLSHRDDLALQWQQVRARRFDDGPFDAAVLSLDTQPAALALRRHALLVALTDWSALRRSGTRRDFAYAASGHTKGISQADWNWLHSVLDVASHGIDAHTPLLLLRAPFTLLAPQRIELSAVPDFIGLSEQLIEACQAIDGRVARYRLYENRTSFEHACRAAAADEAVIWLPGQPPTWWRSAVTRLLALAPAPALIAADPDPAGIDIALRAGAVWTQAGLAWSPWDMDAAVLNRLPHQLPLTDGDRALLHRLTAAGLPDTLAALAAAMHERGVKGEQEGLRPVDLAQGPNG